MTSAIPDLVSRYELVRRNSFRILRMWGAVVKKPKNDYEITETNIAEVMRRWSFESYNMKEPVRGKKKIRIIYATLGSDVLDPDYSDDGSGKKKMKTKKKTEKDKKSKQIGISSVRLTMMDNTFYVLVHEGNLSSKSSDYVQEHYHCAYKIEKFFLLANDHILSPMYSILEERDTLNEMSLSKGKVKILPRMMDLHLIPYKDRIPNVEFFGSNDEMLEITRNETIIGTYASMTYRYILPFPKEKRKVLTLEMLEEEDE